MVSGISGMSTSSLTEMRQKMFDQIDTNGDGSLDKSEIAALIEQNTSSMVDNIFAQMDTDGDSAISRIESNAEMSKLGQEMKGRGPGMQGTQGPPPPEDVFETADTDGDGMVSEDELAAVMGAEGTDISQLFSEVDTDGDGLISKTEDEAFRAQMTEQMQPRGPGMRDMQGPPPPEEVFETADTDGDDMVSEAELAAVMGAEGADISQLFSEVDTDGDGLISKTEDETFRAKMAEQTNPNKSSSTSTDSVAGLDQDWQNRIFTALLQNMIAGYSAKENSTSVYA